MENTIKNWKRFKEDVNVNDAIRTLEKQEFNGIKGDYAIKSMATGRFITVLDWDKERLKVQEVLANWIILVPDDSLNQKTHEIAQMVKRSNWTGLTYPHIDSLTLDKLWKYVAEKIGYSDDLTYKVMNWFFSNEIYKKK